MCRWKNHAKKRKKKDERELGVLGKAKENREGSGLSAGLAELRSNRKSGGDIPEGVR